MIKKSVLLLFLPAAFALVVFHGCGAPPPQSPDLQQLEAEVLQAAGNCADRAIERDYEEELRRNRQQYSGQPQGAEKMKNILIQMKEDIRC